jgi:hypothetical protein
MHVSRVGNTTPEHERMGMYLTQRPRAKSYVMMLEQEQNDRRAAMSPKSDQVF